MQRDPVSKKYRSGGNQRRHQKSIFTIREIKREREGREGGEEERKRERSFRHEGPKPSLLTHCFLRLDLRMDRSTEEMWIISAFLKGRGNFNSL